ncbi:MAG: hypothetical protein V1816_28170 [Pseudomonadota bacterium]
MFTQEKTRIAFIFYFFIVVVLAAGLISCAPSKPKPEAPEPAAQEAPALSLEQAREQRAAELNAGLAGTTRYVVSKPNFCLVLNPDPSWYGQADWSGGCDDDGFAQGEGTLTWSYMNPNLADRSAIFAGRLDKGVMAEGKMTGFSVDVQRLADFQEEQRRTAAGEKEVEVSRLIKSQPPEKQDRLDVAGRLNATLAGKGRWMVDEMNYCLVWNPNPVAAEKDSKYKEDYVTWLGKCDVDGYASGHGILTWYYGEKNVAEDEETGTMEKGNFVGTYKAVYLIGDGAKASKYQGEVVIDPKTGSGMMQGRGVYTWAGGDYYEGEYRDNKREGYGKMVFKNPPRPTMAGYWKDDQFIKASPPPESSAGPCEAQFVIEIPGYPDAADTLFEYRCAGPNEDKSVGCKQVVMMDGTTGWSCGDAMAADRQQAANAACGCF